MVSTYITYLIIGIIIVAHLLALYGVIRLAVTHAIAARDKGGRPGVGGRSHV